MPRAGRVGDELGSPIIAALLARDVVRLCFLQERRHAPLAKRLAGWRERADALARVSEAVAHRQNALGLCRALLDCVSNFYEG
ncbi:hypothetical protein DFJ73DRAFT_784872 [Zopfochytrium polystomum]|nr:hypothetical protein DFJ73DRAFT_784872 [Zopfochytrium polystomum]